MSSPSPVLIVSGLPRSGTSLLMQMLFAGGAPLLFDSQRPNDEFNPRGYFEFAPVKRLRKDGSWLKQAVGKGVKVVSPLLGDLPAGYSYRVLLIERALSEVAASQYEMMKKSQPADTCLTPAALLSLLSGSEAETNRLLTSRADFEFERISHGELLAEPARVTGQISRFLRPVWPALELNVPAMVSAVDPTLYRQREPC